MAADFNFESIEQELGSKDGRNSMPRAPLLEANERDYMNAVQRKTQERFLQRRDGLVVLKIALDITTEVGKLNVS